MLVPLSDDGYLFADLLLAARLPCLVVARSTLGTINHTLLTLEALRGRGIAVLGAVLDGPLNLENRRAIERFLDGAVDLHDVLNRTVRLLAQLTRQVAVVQYPTLRQSAVRHLELVQVASARLLLVLITDTCRVEQRVVEAPVELSADDIADMRARLNATFAGLRLSEAGSQVSELLEHAPQHLRDTLAGHGYEVAYTEYIGGHDYVNWRRTFADGLLALSGAGR